MKTPRDLKLQRLIAFDNEIRQVQHCLIGIDEAGRGPLCGPVVAAAIILPELSDAMLEMLKYLDDSKKFSGNEKRREDLYEVLTHSNCIYGIAEGSVEEIEVFNIFQTTYKTMYRAYEIVLDQLGTAKHQLLIDGQKTIDQVPKGIPQNSVIKGDSKSASIAAASILAKVYRDNKLRQMDKEFPEYKWEKNKGYPTKDHIEAIREHGRCKYHRQTFKVKGLDVEKNK